MERKRSNGACVLWLVLLAGLVSHNLVIPVMSTSLEDQKNYYSPDPNAGAPPTGSHTSPPHHGTTPSHGSGGGYGSTPPSHTPSHGGGGSYKPSPSTPPPSGGNCGSPPHHDPNPTPSNPPSGGGGYYHSPPHYDGGSPPTPIIVSPPTNPTDPGTPTNPIPTPPFFPAPTPPIIGTCSYWRNHPGLIWGLLGWWGTLGSAFGVTSNIPGFGANLSLQEALSNTRTDGLGALYREGTASLLNSMANHRFPYTTKQVRERFESALSSNKAAAAQARLFKMANEGRMKPRL